ncbi:hypothetical protein [Mesorhizobium sp. Cs1321R2N1]|uniref:hypothetical protein n=1 Tax=Mesorhizobium sp. Cs1321R2N1 TaxID=3015174 RepID=UPI00301D83A5
MNAPVGTLKPFGIPEGMDPRTWRKAIEAQLNDLFDRATSLITALDCMEADCDLEETNDDEPSLGWSDRGPQATSNMFLDGRGSAYDDREQDNSDDEDDGTLEPSPGAPERCSQAHWADGSRGDHEREEDHDREWEAACAA